MGLFNSIRLGSSGAGDYEIERSLRFNDDDTAYLSRDFGSGGNRKKWTFSAWIKRGNLGGQAGEQRIFGGDTNASHIFFPSNDEITWDVAAPGSSASGNLNTTHIFRDPSAWFHLVCALDTDESTADNRMRMYINGTEVTSFGTRTNPSSGYALNAINADGDRATHTLGYRTSAQGSAGMEFDGYMAEVHFIDGQQYDASYFAETDAITGEYKPKKYAGGYGTTGFYLNFSDNSGTTATTLGKDSSGNSNNWTPNNFSVSAGTGNDSLEDSPTNNWCTLNPLDQKNTSIQNGNLTVTQASDPARIRGTFSMRPDTGKWYYEMQVGSGASYMFGMLDIAEKVDSVNGRVGYYGYNGAKVIDSTDAESSYGASYSAGDTVAILYDSDNHTVNFYKNNADQGQITGVSDTKEFVPWVYLDNYGTAPNVHINFGQRAFAYTPPTGAKTLCSANLPEPTIAFPNKHFGTLLWTGNATVRTISDTSKVNFTPDMVWVKCRSATHDHQLTDSVRGTSKALAVNTNGQEVDWDTEYSGANQGMGDYTNGGFGLDDNGNNARYNANSQTYVAWNWKGGGTASSNTNGGITSSVSANTTAGFSILTYTGTGSQTTVGHGLGVKPKVIITKLRDSNTQDWFFYPKQLTGTGATYIKFNTNDAVASDAHTYPNVEPTSTVYTVGGDDGGDGTNGNGKAYVAYCWSEVAGYSKFGKYVGNGDNDGVFVYTGFKVKWLLIRRTSSEHWILADTARNSNVGRESPADSYLLASANNAESTGIVYDMLSNGFKFRSNSQNENGSTYVYMAFAESPFKYSRAR